MARENTAHVVRSFCFCVVLALATAQAATGQGRAPLPECEWCGADEAPDRLSWTMTIADSTEPGERLVLSGTVYQADGETPAPSVLIYAYHTNATGIYPRRGDEVGNGRRHGYLRGWLRTDDRGRYRIVTIRPGTYPSRSEPAHIHMTLRPPGKAEFWIDSVNFEGDPLLTQAHRRRLQSRGGTGVVRLEPDGAGGWSARRDILLEP